MKRSLMIAVLFCFLMGCSKSPLERLTSDKPEHIDDNRVQWKPMSKEDKTYWLDAAKKGSKEFKSALDYCHYDKYRSDMCEIIVDLNTDCEMDKTYEPGGWLVEPRATPKKSCESLEIRTSY